MAPVTTLNVVSSNPAPAYRTAGATQTSLSFAGIKAQIETQLAKATGDVRTELMGAMLSVLKAERSYKQSKGWA